MKRYTEMTEDERRLAYNAECVSGREPAGGPRYQADHFREAGFILRVSKSKRDAWSKGIKD